TDARRFLRKMARQRKLSSFDVLAGPIFCPLRNSRSGKKPKARLQNQVGFGEMRPARIYRYRSDGRYGMADGRPGSGSAPRGGSDPLRRWLANPTKASCSVTGY